MRIAVFESIITTGGHEVDFDRLLIEELVVCGHEPILYVPEKFPFQHDYTIPIHYLQGCGVSYAGVTGLKKNWLSLVREYRRYQWFTQLYREAAAGKFDAIIIPTSTYRYLKGLKRSPLKNSPVPVLFVMHGINPTEKPKVKAALSAFMAQPQIQVAVIHCGGRLFPAANKQIQTIKPPTYKPRDLAIEAAAARQKAKAATGQDELILGFFGQYRREKNLEAFLQLFLDCRFTRPVKCVIQGATVDPADRDDFDRLIDKYGSYKEFQFIHKGLFGREWQEAILAIDALVMPYAAPRYRYHWGGMLFTAIGFQKPVLLSDDINPEVLDSYEIGLAFDATDSAALKQALTEFVNTFDEQEPTYTEELERAAVDFAPNRFVQGVVQILTETTKERMRHDS
ncbi:MAG: glycosyltransferase [Sporomusaceae bacterium]|nr:glycosyltransferase [Sporomusaceae bacterium]